MHSPLATSPWKLPERKLTLLVQNSDVTACEVDGVRSAKTRNCKEEKVSNLSFPRMMAAAFAIASAEVLATSARQRC